MLKALPHSLPPGDSPTFLSPLLRCQSLIHPVFLPAVGHGSQRGVSCCQASTEDNTVMQAVGLALPELHYLGVQDVATPTGKSRGLLCPPPLSQEAPGMQLRASQRRSIIPQTGPQGPFLNGHQAQVSLTSILAWAPLGPGRAAPVPHFSFLGTVQRRRQRKSQAWEMIHLKIYKQALGQEPSQVLGSEVRKVD